MDSVQFSGVKFLNEVDFRGTKFLGSLNLIRARFPLMEIPWNSIKNEIVYDGSLYLSLIKNYRNLEWFKDEDDCYYQYRRESQKRKRIFSKEKGWDFSIFYDIISWLSCGYGVRIRFMFFWFLALILFFALILKFATSQSILDCIYDSTVTFTTSNPYNLPQTGLLKYIIVIERFLGILSLSLFLVVLTKKLIR